MTKQTTRLAALALALAAGAGAAPLAVGQDLPLPGEGFDWEHVGDRAIQPFDLAFGPDGTLWATANYGPHRLDLTGGSPGVWVLLTGDGAALTGAILPLGRGPSGDTLVAATSGGSTRRSTDGGAMWAEVYDEGWLGLYEVPAGLPYAGRVLLGDPQDVAYSDDRAASFVPAVMPLSGGGASGASDFAALPQGASNPGRILAAADYGAALSDDGGATFRESGLWVAGHRGERVGVVGGDAGEGGHRAVLAGLVNGQPDYRAWTSDDGETWLPEGGVRLPEGPPFGVGGGAKAVLPLGGSSAFIVLGRGTVYRTDDTGGTWEAVGRAPDINEDIYLESAALGPDGRLYVGLREIGAGGEGWVYRTAEVVTANEPSIEPAADEPVRVEVHPNPAEDSATVSFTLRMPCAVEAVLYDVLGRQATVLVSGRFAAGRHAVALDGSALPDGTFVVRVVAGSAVASCALTLVR
jgi:hypothetical protein